MMTMCRQTDFDIAQPFTSSQLSKRHGQKLFPTGEPAHTAISVITTNATAKLLVIEERQDLGEYRCTLIHAQPPAGRLSINCSECSAQISNRGNPILAVSRDYCWT